MTKAALPRAKKRKKASVASDAATSVNVLIGARIRHVRMLASITQQSLAYRVGVTVQQIQNYEYGSCRISAAQLLRIAEIVGVPMSVFFQGISSPQLPSGDSTVAAIHAAENPELELGHRHEIELVRNFRHIRDEEMRRWTLNLLRTLASHPENSTD